jgi:hypothetical protein
MQTQAAEFSYRVFGYDGETYLLDTKDKPTLPTGTPVSVTGLPLAALDSNEPHTRLAVLSLEPLTASAEAYGVAAASLGTAKPTMRILFILVNMCGKASPLTVQVR